MNFPFLSQKKERNLPSPLIFLNVTWSALMKWFGKKIIFKSHYSLFSMKVHYFICPSFMFCLLPIIHIGRSLTPWCPRWRSSCWPSNKCGNQPNPRCSKQRRNRWWWWLNWREIFWWLPRNSSFLFHCRLLCPKAPNAWPLSRRWRRTRGPRRWGRGRNGDNFSCQRSCQPWKGGI